MSKDTTSQVVSAIGVDLGDRSSSICVLSDAGNVVRRATIQTTRKGFERFFGRLEPTMVIMEVGTHSPWVSHLLEGLGHEVVVANPRRVRLITQSRKKSDRVDAEMLVRLGRVDRELLSPVQHRGPEAQRGRARLRSRAALVECRTKLANCARGLTKTLGERIPKCSAASIHNRVGALSDEVREVVSPLVQACSQLTAAIRRLDTRLEALAEERYPEVEQLRQVKGVGPLTALALVLTIEDSSRFKRSREVGPYLGLTPRRDQSGDLDKQLGITKAGDEMVRRYLVSAASYILGPFGEDSDLRRWGHKLAARGGHAAKMRARVAVARKLGVLLHRLWVSGEDYEPLRNTRRQEAVDPPDPETSFMGLESVAASATT